MPNFLFFYRRESEDGTYFVEWNTISEAQYLYDKSVKQYGENIYNPFASPSQIYTNVTGGIGLFAYKIELLNQSN